MGNPTSTQAVLITATSLAYFSVQFHFGAPPMPSYQPLPTCTHYSFLSNEQHCNLYILQGRDKTSIQPMPSAATRKSAYCMIKHTLIDDFQYVIPEHHLSCDVGHGRFRKARSQDVALSCLWRPGMLLAFTSPYVFNLGVQGDIMRMPPQEVGAAAAYEAHRQIKYGTNMYQFLYSDYERQREALRGMAIAEGNGSIGLSSPYRSHPHVFDSCALVARYGPRVRPIWHASRV